MNDVAGCLEHTEYALSIAADLGGLFFADEAAITRATALASIGELEAALELARRAAENSRDNGARIQQGRAHRVCANVLSQLGEDADALDELDRPDYALHGASRRAGAEETP